MLSPNHILLEQGELKVCLRFALCTSLCDRDWSQWHSLKNERFLMVFPVCGGLSLFPLACLSVFITLLSSLLVLSGIHFAVRQKKVYSIITQPQITKPSNVYMGCAGSCVSSTPLRFLSVMRWRENLSSGENLAVKGKENQKGGQSTVGNC